MAVFSSEDARQDFQRLFPDSSAETRILHFHTPVSSSVFTLNPTAAREHYQLPERFLICCNQFWKHKNHLLLFTALAGLRDRGVKIPLVCTGSLEDYRFADYQRSVQDAIAANRLETSVHLLGMIPREHQLQLLRGAVALVQPSLFEGWSTVVEDGRAFDKPQLLSDLAVHREQSPPHATYFNRHSADDLMEKLHALWIANGAGPDLAAESKAREASVRSQQVFAQNLQTLALDTIRLWNPEASPLSLPSINLSPQRFLKHTLS
jgi:glycosyltransferase involved in cell wall biosynthesis